jgi:hypothetical protein
VTGEALAVTTAVGHVPVPRVVDRLELDGTSAVLFEWLPGPPGRRAALDTSTVPQ